METARDGAAALASALAEPPALVLTDVMMPGMDGFGLLAGLRAHDATRAVPVLLLSARAGKAPRTEALQAGADDYIVKPFTAGELLARVGIHLQMARLRADGLRSLADSEARYRALVAASSDAVYRMSPDWSELRFLQGREFIADTREPDRGWLEKYILPEDQVDVLAAIASAIATKSAFQLEHRVRLVDGSIGWTFSRAVPLLDASGEIVEWFGAASDISIRRRAQEALKEADRRKDEFLAVLSHELRNPLAPLRSATQLLGKVRNDAKVLERTRLMMERQVSQVVRLVDDLLDMTRINQGKVRLRLENIDLVAVVLSALESARPGAEARKQRLVMMLPPRPMRLDADPVRLGQVFGNLLNNASKFTPEGGEIRVAVDAQDGRARVTVRDNGIGIPPDKLALIFEMFSQVDSSIERAHAGLGIGLTLARRLVELHGGTLDASSDGPGRGSEFAVRLSMPRLEATRVAEANGTDASPAERARRRVLVVDDNVDAADTLAQLLQLCGHEAYTSHDGERGIAAAERLQPDIILLDIGLPGMSGHDVCRRLRAQTWGARIVIYALTGWGQPEDLVRSRDAGFNGHLTKPVDLAELERVLAG